MENITKQLRLAQKATQAIKNLLPDVKKQLLQRIAAALKQNTELIIAANKKDLDLMSPEDARYDRLLLDAARIQALAVSILEVSNLADPSGQILLEKVLDNGLEIKKKTVPLGVVAVIYEARPNVTVDVAALCIQSGNACLLRGGSDAYHSNQILVELIQEALVYLGLDKHIVQLLPTDRKFMMELLTATAYVDIIIPRGSQSLIDYVRAHAKVPVIETGAGVCHTYVERTGNLEDAAQIVANAKITRPAVCNSLDTVLVDREVAADFMGLVAPLLAQAEVEIFADEQAFALLEAGVYPYLQKATAADFGREFLSLKCSIKVVDSFEEALAHITQYSSKHSEAIIAQDPEKIVRFMNAIDAAAVYSNASTRFTDGGEFGLGAEIGISTQKLHARGPFALEKLVCEKWFVTGSGQIRI